MNVSVLTQFAAEETSGIGALGVDPLAILLQAGTFLLLFLIIKKFALSKIVDTLEQRRLKIEEGLKNADQIEEQLAKTEAETEKALAKARKDAEEVIGKAHEEAGQLILKAEEDAAAKADKIIEDAQKKIEADINKVRAELKKEMLNLVSQATEIVIEEKLDPKKDAALIEKALEGVK